MDGPLLWFANRGTGVVVLLLLTVTSGLGVLSTHGGVGRRWPRFLTQSLHRNVSLLAAATLAVHVTTAVVDEYVDIRWWQAFIPVGATYMPLWLGLGTVALDLTLAVLLTSLLRHRMAHRPWRAVHTLAYASWAFAVAHGLGIGTDASTPWGRWVSLACAAAVICAAAGRVVALDVSRRHRRRALAAAHARSLSLGRR